jgi:transcriptional regulator with XRE-family HTH domain
VAPEDDLQDAERNFAREMKRRRKEFGMSQADLLAKLHAAGLTYLNQTALSRMENGSRQVRLVEAQAIAHIYLLTIESMMQPSPMLSLSEAILRFVDHGEEVRAHLDDDVLDLIDTAGEISSRLESLEKELGDMLASDLPPLVNNALVRARSFKRGMQETLQGDWFRATAERLVDRDG